jgi:AraC-like DNA-binding protein
MHDIARRARVVRGESAGGSWERVTRPPRPELRPYIHDFCGYTEHTGATVRRLEFPVPVIVVIIEFGPPVRVYGNGQFEHYGRHPGGFVAGLSDRLAAVEHDGVQRGVQLNLTPVGGHLFFGLPMSELTDRVVAIEDLLDRDHRGLADRLESLPDWDARFDLIEALVAARARPAPGSAGIVWACGEIARTGGTADIGTLGEALGWSHRHFAARFREQAGLTPKLLARIVRFDRLIRHLRSGREGTWADLAVRFGYYDQSHLVRDVRQFTGTTPTRVRASLDELSWPSAR